LSHGIFFDKQYSHATAVMPMTIKEMRRLRAYEYAAYKQRLHAWQAKPKPGRAQARPQNLSKAPWTLYGGAVETNRRKH
jgi:hypothetical protein